MFFEACLACSIIIGIFGTTDATLNVTDETVALALPSFKLSWSANESSSSTIFYQKIGQPYKNLIVLQNQARLTDLEFNSNYGVFVQTSTADGLIRNSTKEYIGTIKAPIPLVVSKKNVQILLLQQKNAMFYHIIVKKLDYINQPLRDLPKSNTVLSGINDPGNANLYVAYHHGQFNEKTKIISLGTNSKTSYNGKVVTNIPLVGDTQYSFFQRTYYNNTHSTSNEWMKIVKTSKKKNRDDPVKANSFNETEIATITVGVAIGVIAIVFLILCICHYKFTIKYAPQAKPKRNQDAAGRISSHPSIPVTELDFYDHVSQMKFHNFKGFYDEFSLLKKTEFRVSEEFRRPKNVSMDRYLNKPLGSVSRVVLEGDQPYIFANFIPGTDSEKDYIVTQNPLPETVKDFWNMVLQNNISNIVMIGEFVEKGEPVCAKYIPDDEINDFIIPEGKVSLVQTHSTADFHIRTLHVQVLDKKEPRVIKHFQYISWPNVRLVPEVVTTFLSFIKVIKDNNINGLNEVIVVHGSTVADRAGIYMCVDSQIRRIEDQTDVNIYNQVSDIKLRLIDGIKTLDEYIFLHDAILEFIMKRKIKNIPVAKLPMYVENVFKQSSIDPFSVEYSFLISLPSTLKMDAGNQTYNKDKNRYQNIKPFDTNRVKLSKFTNKAGSDYINASWVDTYIRKKAFIASQAPLVETVADFWRMISETKSWVIIMLGQEIENGQLKADRFWPIEANIMSFGDFNVKLLTMEQNTIPDVITRQIELFNKKTGTSNSIQLYQYVTWPSHKEISSESINSLMRLVNLADSWEMKLKAKTVTVVSSSGIGRAGVFIALRSLQEESDLEGSLNVFRTVQRLRQQRTALVQTREEYILIYTSAIEISQKVRRRTILNESLFDLKTTGLDILPDGYSVSSDGSIVGKRMRALPSVPSETSQF